MSFLDELILAHAETNPAAVAVRFGDSRWTYADLRARTAQLSRRLAAVKHKSGHFVVALLDPGPEIIPTALAAFRMGGIYAPLDPDYPDTQLLDRLEQMTSAVIVTSAAHAARAAQWGHPVLLADEPSDGLTTSPPAGPRAPSDLACVFFTSGSTGKPKGVVGDHLALRCSVTEPAAYLGLDATSTVDSLARYSWSISMLELFAPLVSGGTCLVLDRMQALNLPWLAENARQCTAFHCPPALLTELVAYAESRSDLPPFTEVRFVWYGGDQVAPAVLARAARVFPNARIATAYGATEIFGLSHCHVYPEDQDISEVCIGKPVPGMLQRLDVVPGEDVFELYLGGPRVALGYLEGGQLNREKFPVQGGGRSFRTGDYVRVRDDGALIFSGRRDAQVKIRGIRVELGEIEHQVRAAPGVEEALVLAKENSAGVKELHAFFTAPSAGADITPLVRATLGTRLPDYLVPKTLHQLAAFPKTANFKIDRVRLLELTERPSSQSFAGDTPLDRIARAWVEAGGQPSGDPTQSFFDAGGDSLSAARLATLLTREFGASVGVADVFAAPTLQDQERHLASLSRAATAEGSGSAAAEGQRGLFFRELFEGKKGSITCTRYVRRKAGFEPELVTAALEDLVARWPTLRTTIRPGKGTLYLDRQESAAEAPLLKKLDGVYTLGDGPGRALGKQTVQFDLGRGPLVAATLAALDDGSELLQLTAHHIASDDNSMGRLADDFIRLYEARRSGSPPMLASAEDDFDDFCREQHARIAAHTYEATAATLGRQLASHIEIYPTPLLVDQTGHAAGPRSSSVLLSQQTSPRFAEVVAALSWTMMEQFDRTAFVFCAHVALRRNDAATPRVGMFVNLLPLVCTVDPLATPKQHAATMGRILREAMARSDVPYEVVMRSHPELRRRRTFPFDAFVNELRFDNTYPAGYEDIVVRRSFATDASEINLSLVRAAQGDDLVIEGPAERTTAELLGTLASGCRSFLDRLAG